MTVSAVMVSYHTGEVLWDCLEAAIRDCDEVVLVDNGNPLEVSATLSADTRIRYLGGHGNIGFSAACNRGAELATGEHILILNPDAQLIGDCVQRLVEVAGQYPSPSIIGARLVDEDGAELRGSRRRTLTPWTAMWGRNLHRKPLPDAPIRVGAVSGAAMLLGRESWNRLGGFDDRYFLHVEDLDICRRATELGGVCIFVSDAEVLHAGATSDVDSWVVETYKTMGLRRYLTTHHPWLGRLVFYAMFPVLRRRMRRGH